MYFFFVIFLHLKSTHTHTRTANKHSVTLIFWGYNISDDVFCKFKIKQTKPPTSKINKQTITLTHTQAKQYIKEMAELSKRIQAAHGHHGNNSHHHHHNQQQQQPQQHIVERYKEISSGSDDPSNLPKPLSVVEICFLFSFFPRFFFFLNTKYNTAF